MKFFHTLIFSILAFSFISCGDDEVLVEIPNYNKENLIGDYSGNCTVKLGDNKSETITAFPGKFKQKDDNLLYLDLGDQSTYQSIGISPIVVASNFKSYNKYAQFQVDNLPLRLFNPIPNFFKSLNLAFEIESVEMNLSCSGDGIPQYYENIENLTFTYSGQVIIKGAKDGGELKAPISYKFNLNKVQPK